MRDRLPAPREEPLDGCDAYVAQWMRTHSIRDLRDLAVEMSDRGEDVSDIAQLVVDLTELEQALRPDAELALEDISAEPGLEEVAA